MTERLDVYLYSVRVAQLTRTAPLQYGLRYRSEWLDDELAMPISLSLPLANEEQEGEILTAFLDNLLPDNADVRERWALDAELPTVEPFGLLRAYGRDVAGALQFVEEGVDPDAERGSTPLNESDIARRIRAVRDDATHWQDPRDHQGYFSLGGAQGKFAIARTDSGWCEPLGRSPTTHIFKPTVRGQTDGEVIEHLTMQTARTLGLEAAATEMLEFGGEHSLVVERFDRVRVGDSVVRLHQEDLTQAFGLTRLQKYENRGGPNYRRALGLLKAETSPSDRPRSVESFVKALMFSWMVLNTDAHAKNYSIFITPNGIRLTPLYDVSSLLPYLGREGDDERALRRQIDSTQLSMRIAADFEVGRQSFFEWQAVAREAGLDVETITSWANDAALLIPVIVRELASRLPPGLQTDVVNRYVEHAAIRSAQLLAEMRRRG